MRRADGSPSVADRYVKGAPGVFSLIISVVMHSPLPLQTCDVALQPRCGRATNVL